MGHWVKACPHLFPKQETLYQETGDFVAENGYKVACFRIQSALLDFQLFNFLVTS